MLDHTNIGRIIMSKFKSFEEKIVDYQIRFLKIVKNPQSKRESKTLYKARLDILKRINVGLDGFLTFSQSINGSFTSKSVRTRNFKFHNDSLSKKLSDFELSGQSNQVKKRFVQEQIKFASDLFTPQKIKQILDEIFLYNKIKIAGKLNKKHNTMNPKITKWEYDEPEKRSQEQTEYYLSIAKILVEKGINEFKKYLDEDSELDKPIISQLESTIAVLNLLSKDKTKTLIKK